MKKEKKNWREIFELLLLRNKLNSLYENDKTGTVLRDYCVNQLHTVAADNVALSKKINQKIKKLGERLLTELRPLECYWSPAVEDFFKWLNIFCDSSEEYIKFERQSVSSTKTKQRKKNYFIALLYSLDRKKKTTEINSIEFVYNLLLSVGLREKLFSDLSCDDIDREKKIYLLAVNEAVKSLPTTRLPSASKRAVVARVRNKIKKSVKS